MRTRTQYSSFRSNLLLHRGCLFLKMFVVFRFLPRKIYKMASDAFQIQKLWNKLYRFGGVGRFGAQTCPWDRIAPNPSWKPQWNPATSSRWTQWISGRPGDGVRCGGANSRAVGWLQAI
jgi:hypothetical protein